MNIKDKTIVITGAARGLGAAMAKRLAGHQPVLALVDMKADDLAATAEACRQAGARVECFAANVAVEADVIRLFDEIVARCGTVHALVNNAGITRDALLHKMTLEQWQEVMRTNLDSMFNLSRLVIEDMRAKGFGRIINISSINGQTGQMGQTNYAAAKAGVFGFTKSLARECANKGITVNAVAPGYINTEMVAAVNPEVLKGIISKIPVGRLGEAKEIARAVCFLADEEAGFITGETLSVNGGQHME